ncbi:MAG: hypothetical protein IH616_21360, partial [Gemmatimonadales bacterium]|nr:hypothetical protein [Gemmatimonadales bacterium]
MSGAAFAAFPSFLLSPEPDAQASIRWNVQMTTEPSTNATDEASLAKAKAALAKAEASESRYRQLSGTWRMVLILLTSLALLLALNQMLNLHLTGSAILSNSYLYALCALLTGAAFLLMPAGPNAPRDR